MVYSLEIADNLNKTFGKLAKKRQNNFTSN